MRGDEQGRLAGMSTRLFFFRVDQNLREEVGVELVALDDAQDFTLDDIEHLLPDLLGHFSQPSPVPVTLSLPGPSRDRRRSSVGGRSEPYFE